MQGRRLSNVEFYVRAGEGGFQVHSGSMSTVVAK